MNPGRKANDSSVRSAASEAGAAAAAAAADRSRIDDVLWRWALPYLCGCVYDV